MIYLISKNALAVQLHAPKFHSEMQHLLPYLMNRGNVITKKKIYVILTVLGSLFS